MSGSHASTLPTSKRGASFHVWIGAVVPTAVTGIVLDLAGVTLQRAQLCAAGVAIISLGLGLWIESNNHEKSVVSKFPKWSDLLTPGLGSLVATSFLVMMSAFGTGLQASVLNLKLHAALGIDDPTRRKVQAWRVLQYAARVKVSLDPVLVSKTEQASVPTPPILSVPLTQPTWQGFVRSAENSLGTNRLEIIPDTMNIKGMSLDDSELANSSISGQVVQYRGGPLTLVNTTFNDVTFQLSDSENSRALVEALRSTKGEAITLTLK